MVPRNSWWTSAVALALPAPVLLSTLCELSHTGPQSPPPSLPAPGCQVPPGPAAMLPHRPPARAEPLTGQGRW